MYNIEKARHKKKTPFGNIQPPTSPYHSEEKRSAEVGEKGGSAPMKSEKGRNGRWTVHGKARRFLKNGGGEKKITQRGKGRLN